MVYFDNTIKDGSVSSMMTACKQRLLKPHCVLQVRVLRPESYWFRETGKVVSVDQVKLLCEPLITRLYIAWI